MKMNLKAPLFYLFACVFFAGSSSCTDMDSVKPGSDRVAVVFTPQIGGTVTRAADQSWTADDRVGIAMVSAGSSLPDNSPFSRYKVSGAGSTGVSLSPETADETLFYPTSGGNVNFVAFSPYATVTGNAVAYSVTDQSTRAKMEAVDFLYHKGATAYNKASASAALAFGHKLSKIVINATTTGDATAIPLSTLTMAITGTPGSVTANLASGSVTAGGNAAIAPFHTGGDGSNPRVATAILVPHNAKKGRTITFTATVDSNPVTYTYTFPSDEFAFGSNMAYTLNFIVTRRGVTLSGATIDAWNSGAIDWKGKYMFEFTSGTYSFDYNNGAHSNAGPITFNCNYGGTVGVALSTSGTDVNAGDPGWVTGTLTSTNKGNYTEYSYTFNIKTNNVLLTPARTVYAHIMGGNASLAVVALKQAAGPVPDYATSSNCYIVKPGATVWIPVSRANEYAPGAIGKNDAFTAEFLWADAPGLLSEVNAYGTGAVGTIKVVAASGNKAGNAVVAVKVGGVIKWSWHIWVTEYDPDNGGATYTNTYNTNKNGKHFVFMDRNLGATFAGLGSGLGTGLFYQWGRKDPFPATGAKNDTQPGGGSFTTAVTSSLYGKVEYTIQNPGMFLTGSSSSSYDWHFAKRDNTLWGHNAVKSIYDPCPAGWRVPVNSGSSFDTTPWYGFGDSGNKPTNLASSSFSTGYNWGTNAVYPAAGHRNYGSGVINLPGSYGFYWSASPYSSSSGNASDFYFYSGGVFLDSGNNRALGSSVRCVKE
jgi:hypothetical protein